MYKKTLLFIWIFLFCGFVSAQDRLKIVFYNLFEYPQYLPTNRAPTLKNILSDINPDLFMVCELLTEEGADDILYNAMNYDADRNFARAPFIPNQSSDSDMQQLLYYDSDIWELLSTELLITNYRDINKYKLQLLTKDGTEPVYVYAFITHLKSSPGLANRMIRLEMAETLTAHLQYIEPDAFVVFSGDFNLYSSDEEAYQELLDEENSIVFKDPIDSLGDWHENEAFSYLHTQSTRVSNVGFGTGASGGMDDRFDFIMLSENFFEDNPNLQYVAESYQAYGNNGNCYKKDINDPSCTGEFSQQTRDWLYLMSDHLPVVLELETNKILHTQTIHSTPPTPFIIHNPVGDYLKVFIPEPSNSNSFKVEIFNAIGTSLIEKRIHPTETELIIPVEHLATGLYFVRLSNYPQQTLKFIKK
ncbi:MAG TPA: T9SS type A sorting domain-containing protein [Flavobacteriaceae bacterium]|nr:T9SS type A sorting domain-containing protein [Flavobacteriaceae bacterium]